MFRFRHNPAYTAQRDATLALALLALCGSAGCDDPLAPGAYPGEPLATITGTIQVSEANARSGRGPLRITVHWLGNGRETLEVQQTLATGGLGEYTLRLYSPPSRAAWRALPEGAGAMALGRIFLFRDTNGDGKWSPDTEPMVGGAAGHSVLYAPRAAYHHTLGQLLPAGFSIVRNQSCAYDENGQLLPSGSFSLAPGEAVPLAIVRDMSRLNLDLNCDGLVDDPCLKSIAELDPAGELTDEERERFRLDCYGLPEAPTNPDEDPCLPEREAFDASLSADPTLREEARIRYMDCLLTHHTVETAPPCPLHQAEDETGSCVCPVDMGFYLDPQGECMPCGPFDPATGVPPPAGVCP